MGDQAALIVRYPEPVELGDTCQFFVLYADQDHIRVVLDPLPEGLHRRRGFPAPLLIDRRPPIRYVLGLQRLGDGSFQVGRQGIQAGTKKLSLPRRQLEDGRMPRVLEVEGITPGGGGGLVCGPGLQFLFDEGPPA